MTARVHPGGRRVLWPGPGPSRVTGLRARVVLLACVCAVACAGEPDDPEAASEPGGTAETLVRQLTGDNARHVVSYGTEAGYFQKHGFDAVVCGPGDIEQAHQPDEFIEVAQFEAGHAFMRRLLDRLNQD